MKTESAHLRHASGSAVAPRAALWLVLVMLVGLAGLSALMIWQSYKAAVATGEARALSSAHVVAAHLEWMLEASDQALRRVDVAVGDIPVSNSIGAIADIRQAVGDLPEGFQYSVYDETGRLRFSSIPEAVGIDVSDREYFQRLSAGEGIVISPQLEERLSEEQVFVIARRMSRNGEFHGAASIAIPTSTMDEFWSLMELGPDSTVSALRADGWLVARHPQLPETIDFSGTRLFTDLLSEAPAGFYHSAMSPADGLSRIVGYRKIDRWPLIATVGVARSEVLEFFWSSLRAGLLVGVPLMGVLVLGILWIMYLLRVDAERSATLEQALERNQFLFREIHHRVKNNLQAVSSLVRLQPLPKDSKEDMVRRIAAMASVHEQIYGTDQFDRIDFASYAERLTRDVAAGFRNDVEVETHIEPLTLTPDQALPLGLLINELVSNAFKHAIRDRADGRLVVRLSKADKQARLVVEDNGPGYELARDKGMGRRLIDGFVQQLGGALSIDNASGTKVEIIFPVP